MYSTNDYPPRQNYIYCRNNCGVKITFNDNVTSKNGVKIPLQENGLPHDCPKSHFKRRQELQKNTKFVKEFENTDNRTMIDPPRGLSESNSKLGHHSANLTRKITPEQQLYADTIGPAIAEILSLVQEIYEKMFPKVEGF